MFFHLLLASSQMPTAVVQDMSKPSPVNFLSAIGKQSGILESHSTFSLMQMTKDNTNHTVTAKKKTNKTKQTISLFPNRVNRLTL